MRRIIFGLAGGMLLTAHAAYAQEVIRVDGSTGAMPLVSALATEYQAANPGVRIEIGAGMGTAARIEALSAGAIDIAVASHGLDRVALTTQGMTVGEIARTPVVFAVNASVMIEGLTSGQICDIYAGRVTNWSAVGGGNQTIEVRTRPDTEVDGQVMREGVACLTALQMAPHVGLMQSGGDMSRELTATPQSLGMTTSTVVEQSGGALRALTLDGVAANEATVGSGEYALVRETFLVTGARSSPAVAGFLAFIASPIGAELIRANGAIPTEEGG